MGSLDRAEVVVNIQYVIHRFLPFIRVRKLGSSLQAPLNAYDVDFLTRALCRGTTVNVSTMYPNLDSPKVHHFCVNVFGNIPGAPCLFIPFVNTCTP